MSANDKIRVFEYKRGEQYKAQIAVNEGVGSVVFNTIEVPKSTPQAVKEAFLNEAEEAVLKALQENEYESYTVTE